MEILLWAHFEMLRRRRRKKINRTLVRIEIEV